MTELDRLHDIADDIASASWGYELASALHNIAADIGEKVDGMRRVGEYEDDVLTWVEAYGGLEEVKKELSRFIDRSGYESDALGWVEKNGGLDAVKERLMPEDMEWPRFEDNEQVRIGDHWQQDDYDESITRIDSIEFAEDGIRFENEYADTFYRYGERVKRPAPKVLDADGAEIRVGDTVWNDSGNEFEVIGLSGDGKTVHVKWGDGLDAKTGTCAAKNLTHERPDSWGRWFEDFKFPYVLHIVRGSELRRYFPERYCRFEHDSERHSYTCTCCGESFDSSLYVAVTESGIPVYRPMKYCPSCGARLEEQ